MILYTVNCWGGKSVDYWADTPQAAVAHCRRNYPTLRPKSVIWTDREAKDRPFVFAKPCGCRIEWDGKMIADYIGPRCYVVHSVAKAECECGGMPVCPDGYCRECHTVDGESFEKHCGD